MKRAKSMPGRSLFKTACYFQTAVPVTGDRIVSVHGAALCPLLVHPLPARATTDVQGGLPAALPVRFLYRNRPE